MRTKNYFFLLPLLALCFISTPSSAQSAVTFDVAQVFSTFKFTGSDGSQGSFSPALSNAYHLGYQYGHKSGLLLGINIGIRKAGATTQADGSQISWTFQYAESQLSVGYRLNKWRIKPFVLVCPYYGSLLAATENVGGQSYDVKKNGSVASSDYGLIGSLGLNVKLSEYISIYSAYNQIYGIKNIETTSGQQSYNRGFYVNLGIALTIVRTTPKWVQQ